MNVRSIRFFRAGLVLVPLALFMIVAGCQSATTDLEVAIAAGEAVIGVLAGAGTLPQAEATPIDTYMGDAATFLNETTTELGSTDSSLVKAQKIISYASGIAVPALPVGPVKVALEAVQAAIDTIVASMQGVTAQLHALPPGAFAAASSPKHHKLRIDQKKLAQLAKRAQALHQRFPKR